MTFTKIKSLLYETIGLHSDSVGDSSIDRAINHRIQITGLQNTHSYYRLLKDEPSDELAELIEEVVVPETWFFRNLAPFDALREHVTETNANDFNSSIKPSDYEEKVPLRILSVPCSSGEEPYSIAITLFEAGLAKDDFLIDAIDVSKRALKKARQATYGKHAFREKGIDYQNKYFERSRMGFRLDPGIRNQVSFQYGNILKDTICSSKNYYDIIFCRNLLIYFDRETQKKIIDKLTVMLKYNGLIFVGHAESGQIDKNIFSKVRTEKAFAFRKKTIENLLETEGEVCDPPTRKLRDIYNQLVEVTKKDIALSKKISAAAKTSPISQKISFSEIDKLITSGHLSDASKLCEELLQADPVNPDGYYYLGFICNLEGSTGSAESLLRKAIYLSPSHHKALALSAYLAENRGDEDSAKLLRRRGKRARQRNK